MPSYTILPAGRPTQAAASESGSTSNGCYFNDIDQGTIAMPCAPSTSVLEGGATYDYNTGGWIESTSQTHAVQASPNCNIVNSGDVIGTLSGFSATTGYDEATGLGSLNIANVVGAWPTGGPSPTFALSATNVSMGAGATSGNTSTITVMPTDGFIGAVNFTCSVTSTPTNPTSPVTCPATITPADVTGSAEATTTVAVGSTSTTTQGTYVITVHGTTSGSITQPSTTFNVTIAPTYSVTAGAAPNISSPGGGTTSAITVTGSGGYTGNVTLSCSLKSGPANQSGDAPGCNVTYASGSSISLSTTATSGQATAAVTTYAPSTANLVYPKLGNGKGWLGAGGGAVLALVFFFGIPARRRSWRSMLGILVAMVALGILSSCGGSTNSVSTPNPGTAAGTYTFTVSSSTTGTAVTPTPTTTFQVVVN